MPHVRQERVQGARLGLDRGHGVLGFHPHSCASGGPLRGCGLGLGLNHLALGGVAGLGSLIRLRCRLAGGLGGLGLGRHFFDHTFFSYVALDTVNQGYYLSPNSMLIWKLLAFDPPPSF